MAYSSCAPGVGGALRGHRLLLRVEAACRAGWKRAPRVGRRRSRLFPVLSLLPAALTQRARADLAARGVAVLDLDALAAINAEDYVCGPTEIDQWVAENLDLTEEELTLLNESDAIVVAMYAPILFGDVEGTGSFGTDGQYTKTVNHAWKKLRSFWGADLSDVEVVPMHGRALTDPGLGAEVLRALGVPAADAAEAAQLFAEIFDTPRWEHGDHPLLSFNAFAAQADPRGGERAADRIVMGVGIMELFDDLGHGAVAVQEVLAHENFHQAQYATGVIDESAPFTPEESRYLELQADAGSAYSLSHPRGLSMQWNRMESVMPLYHATGDCMFDFPAHHGTPNQRLAAGTWGYELQETTRPRGHVLPMETFIARFDAVLPVLVAPDAR